MSRSAKAAPAMCEDEDEEGHVVEGSYQYARSNVHSTPGSPVRQQPNTGRKKSSRSNSISPNALSARDMDTTPPMSPTKSESRSKAKESREAAERRSSKKVSTKRPSVHSSKTTPAPSSRGSDEASYYGVSHQTVASSSTRPRAQTARPASYYAGQGTRPPLSTSAYYHHPQAQLTPVGSFPPPPPMSAWHQPPPPHALTMMPSAMMATSPLDYTGGFLQQQQQDNLAARFGPSRPRSSMGLHDTQYLVGEPAPKAERTVHRHKSTSRRQKEEDDRARMPPPARPHSTRPERNVVRATSSRKQVGFEEDDLIGDDELYQSVSRRASLEHSFGALSMRPRVQGSGSYDYSDNTVYAPDPTSRGSRRKSQNYALDDKIRNASQYQEQVSGAPPAPLTAESLRQVKNGGSSRSTRSSGSRDESSYKQSSRTTYSDDDEITIRLPKGGIVEVGSAKINCKEGGEVNIGRSGSSRMGSERGGTTVFGGGDDRKSRAERPKLHTRSSSQSASFARPSYPQYAPQYPPPYGYPPPMSHAPHNDYSSLPVDEFGYPDYGRI